MLHKRSDREPKRVRETELVLQVLRLLYARIRVGPFVRANPGHDEEQNGHAAVCRDHPEPDERTERIQEREQTGRTFRRLFVQYADTYRYCIGDRYNNNNIKIYTYTVTSCNNRSLDGSHANVEVPLYNIVPDIHFIHAFT